ncbi:hypothetical protein HDU76_009364, partial [Blyttiomyces sp. JEL0837]
MIVTNNDIGLNDDNKTSIATTSTATSNDITPIEFILLGTGTSGTIPNVTCVTATPPTCKVCLSAMENHPGEKIIVKARVPKDKKDKKKKGNKDGSNKKDSKEDKEEKKEARDGEIIVEKDDGVEVEGGNVEEDEEVVVEIPGMPIWNKNRRMNTSGVYRYRDSDGTIKNILIDCGKTFLQSTLQHFPQHRIHQIAAVLLTHGHIDAMGGLDDLRQWTLYQSVQDTVIVYVNSETMGVVERMFPYIVDSKMATGGGLVPQ